MTVRDDPATVVEVFTRLAAFIIERGERLQGGRYKYERLVPGRTGETPVGLMLQRMKETPVGPFDCIQTYGQSPNLFVYHRPQEPIEKTGFMGHLDFRVGDEADLLYWAGAFGGIVGGDAPAPAPPVYRPESGIYQVPEASPASGAVKPISPDEVGQTKATVLPDIVISAFNELIARHFVGSSANFTQEAVIELILDKMQLPTPSDEHPITSDARAVYRRMIFDRGWLNVEDLYRDNGWSVGYDKPGWGESYAANFTFRRVG